MLALVFDLVGVQMTDDREPIWPKLEDYEPPKATTPWGKLPIKDRRNDKDDPKGNNNKRA